MFLGDYMKYLDFNLYEKLCLPNYDIQDEKKWNRDYNKWLKEFEKIKPTLSKDFLNEELHNSTTP